MTCSKAIGVARTMKNKFADKIDLEIHTTDSEAAKGYVFKGSTTVFLDNKEVPLQAATNAAAMDDYLQKHL